MYLPKVNFDRFLIDFRENNDQNQCSKKAYLYTM